MRAHFLTYNRGGEKMKKVVYALVFLIVLSGCKPNSVANYIKQNEIADNKAQFWAERVNDIEGVETVVVVINGDKAVVELEIFGELSDEKLIPLKDRIEKMILDEDEDIKHVGVTAAPEIISRMAGEKPTDFNKYDNKLSDDVDEKIMEFTPK